MDRGSSILLVAVAAMLLTGAADVRAHDETKYPNLKGQWDRLVVRGVIGQPSFDQTKGWGEYQGAPLTAEYQAIFQENLKDQEAGGLGAGADHARCVAAGMPFMMVAFRPLEFVVTPETTYIIIADSHRRTVLVSRGDTVLPCRSAARAARIGARLPRLRHHRHF